MGCESCHVCGMSHVTCVWWGISRSFDECVDVCVCMCVCVLICIPRDRFVYVCESWVMSRVCDGSRHVCLMSDVTFIWWVCWSVYPTRGSCTCVSHESREVRGRVMSRVSDESCHMYLMSHVTCIWWVMSHVLGESCHVYLMSHVTCIWWVMSRVFDESCHAYLMSYVTVIWWVLICIARERFVYVCESWVARGLWTSHVTCIWWVLRV